MMTTAIHVAAGILWTLAVGLMVAAPSTCDPAYCAACALLIAMVAALATVWIMLRCERHRISTIARLAVSAADEHRRLESI